MKTIKYLYILLAVMLCGTMPVVAQNTNDNHNKAVFQSTDGDSEVNTDDIQIIRFDGGKVTLVQPWGETVFDRTLRNLTFFRPLPGTLRLIVDANIGGEGTDGGNNRAYEINGDGDLISVWRSGDEVYVYADESSTASIGTLTPETYGARSARLTGNINANLNGGETLYLETKPRTFSFATQTGTLSDLFYAKATATVSIVGGNATISDASFTRPMAVVKFTLKDKDVNGNPTFNADALRVTDGTTTVVINDIPAATYTNNGDGVLYVAMPGFTGRDVTVEAYSAGKLYAYTKSNVSFADSKYYDISIKMSPATNINLANVFRDITVTDGCTVTGTLANILKISIADGATVTLDGASINADRAWTNSNNAGITCVGDATIILADGSTNHVNGFNNKYPGIYVPGDPANSNNNKTLTIKGNGTLNASTILGVNDSGAGIGGSGNSHCGNIRIEGGTINATGGKGATGIGGGWNTSCGDITITGGTITAVGGIYAAGIGSGAGTGDTSGRCGDIVITGGTIDATGGDASAGIGGGKTCGNITISDANITAKKGYNGPNSVGAGDNASCGTVTIGGVEYWTGSAYENGGNSYLTQATLVYPKVYTCSSSNWSSQVAAFNAETTAKPTLQLTSDINIMRHEFILTRGDGTFDLNGHTISAFDIRNDDTGKSITIKNGTVSGSGDVAIDGHPDWADFYHGTVILENLTVNKMIFVDGHKYIINSGTYNEKIFNVTTTGYPGKLIIYGGCFRQTIHGEYSNVTYGTYELYGGKYAVRPENSWCATGYCVKDNTDDDKATYPWIVGKE